MKFATAKTNDSLCEKSGNKICTLVSLQYDRYILLFPPRGKANVNIFTIDYFHY
jgi:hypothetical protein